MTEATTTGFVNPEILAALWLKGQDDQQKMLLYSGLPASGKTKAALEWLAEDPNNRFRCNYDDLRLELFGLGWKFNFKDERFMQQIAHDRVVRAFQAGKSVVIDNTNLTPKSRERWKQVAQKNNAIVIEEEFDTPVKLCKERDAKREGTARVGWAVIDHMALFNGFLDFSDREIYPRNFCIFDVDGTLADCEWRRKFIQKKCVNCGAPEGKFPGQDNFSKVCIACGADISKKDWLSFFKGVGDDPPVAPIIRLAKLLSKTFDILVVSGRPIDLCGKATEAWLRQHLVLEGRTPYPQHLFLRNSGDKRPDTEVKLEIAEMLPLDRIAYVIDDRSSVVQAWRSLGLTVLQCADGNF